MKTKILSIGLFLLLGFFITNPVLLGAKNNIPTNGPIIRLKNGTSTNWSGYAVETNLVNPQSYSVGDVKGTWTIPILTCGVTNTYSSAWVGIDGYSDSTVEQTGTEQDCASGLPSYYAWFEMYPKNSYRINLPVSAGDSISAEVKYNNNNKFTLVLVNNTQGKSFNITLRANAKRQSAEWITEAPWSGGVLPLANFGTIPFTNASATLNGQTGSINNPIWQNDPITMTTSTGVVKSSPTSLSSDGTSFNATWFSN